MSLQAPAAARMASSEGYAAASGVQAPAPPPAQADSVDVGPARRVLEETAFFQTQTSTCTARRVLHLKRGGRWRRTLKREDGSHMPLQLCSALGTDWESCLRNQTKPVVVNAFIASVKLKEAVVKSLGDGAMSLGTVGTERAWWHDHLRNLNRCGIWADPAAMRFRAVTSWKSGLRVQLRKLLPHWTENPLLQELCERMANEIIFREDKPFLNSTGVFVPLSKSSLNGSFGAFQSRLVP